MTWEQSGPIISTALGDPFVAPFLLLSTKVPLILKPITSRNILCLGKPSGPRILRSSEEAKQ